MSMRTGSEGEKERVLNKKLKQTLANTHLVKHEEKGGNMII